MSKTVLKVADKWNPC